MLCILTKILKSKLKDNLPYLCVSACACLPPDPGAQWLTRGAIS